MNGKTLLRKRLPLFRGRQLMNSPPPGGVSLHGLSQPQTAASLPSPGEAIETTLQKEPGDNALHQPCWGGQALRKQGLR